MLGMASLANYNARSAMKNKQGLPKDKYGRVIYNAPDIEKKEYYNDDGSLSELEDLDGVGKAEVVHQNKKREERLRFSISSNPNKNKEKAPTNADDFLDEY